MSISFFKDAFATGYNRCLTPGKAKKTSALKGELSMISLGQQTVLLGANMELQPIAAYLEDSIVAGVGERCSRS